MKTETLPDANYILSTYTDKDDLLFYLKTKFESPSIELYINSFGKIEGFTCASLDGVIYSTLRKPATIVTYNYSNHKLGEQSDLLASRTELCGITRDELKNAEQALFFMKVGFFASVLFAAWMMTQHHNQRITIEKLKTEMSKPVLIQDTI